MFVLLLVDKRRKWGASQEEHAHFFLGCINSPLCPCVYHNPLVSIDIIANVPTCGENLDKKSSFFHSFFPEGGNKV